MSKKIMSVMLAIFMLASLCVVGFTSASAASQYYEGYRMWGNTNGNNYAEAGDTITVELIVNTNDRYSLNAQMELFFDETKLELVEKSDEEMWPNLPSAVLFTNTNYRDDRAPFSRGIHVNYSVLKGIDLTGSKNLFYRYTFTALEDINNLDELFCQEFHSFTLFNETGKPSQGDPSTDVVAEDKSGLIEGVTASLVISGGSQEPTDPTDPTDINTAELEALIAEARALAEQGGFTDEEIAALNEAIAAAEAVAGNPESQAQVLEQIKALKEAMDKLAGTTEETTTAEETTAEETTTAPATTEKPEAPQTGEASTAVALMVVAIMAAGVVIFARKKATK